MWPMMECQSLRYRKGDALVAVGNTVCVDFEVVAAVAVGAFVIGGYNKTRERT